MPAANMAGSKFQYDESGGTFFYFLLSFLALILIPISYYLWPKRGKKEEGVSLNKCHCEPCQVKQNRLTSSEPLKKWKIYLTEFLIIAGWIAFLATAYKVAHLERDYVDWNPYDILQVDRGASQAEIKRAYRKLSLLYHPDKDTGDPKKFLQLTKAHAALTDDEARKNWEMYGNPDGPGVMSFGIALPSWIVEKENSFWVLGLYALVFMVALPIIVGVWWRRSIKFGGDKVLLETTKLYYYYINKTPRMALKRVITIIAGSFEFDKSHNSEIIERPTDNDEVPVLLKEFTNFGKSKEPCLSFPYSIKARAILFAHLSRLALPSNTLEQDRLYIVHKCPYLINELVQCVARMIFIFLSGHAQSMPPLDTIENCIKLCPMIVQALWENKHPVLQLPHIHEDMLKHFHRKNKTINRLRDLVRLPYEDRRDILRGLSQEQFDDVMKVCWQMPHIDMNVSAEVLGDEKSTTISCGATVTVTIKLTRKRLLNDLKSPVEETFYAKEEKEDNDDLLTEPKPVEGDAAAAKKKPPAWQKQQKRKGKPSKPKKKLKSFSKKPLQELKPETSKDQNEPSSSKTDRGDESDISDDGSQDSKDNQSDGGKEEDKVKEVEDSEEEDETWAQLQSKISHKEKIPESKSRISHTVHCPFFSEDKQEYWWLYIVDIKKHLLMTVPFFITDLVDEKEVTLQITAPDKVGVYSYGVYLKSDSYVDSDFKENFKLNVTEVEKEDTFKYGISDDEKDESEKEEDDSTGLITDEDSDATDSDDDDN